MPERTPGELSPSDVEAFQCDGVICIRGAIPRDWIDRMAEAVERTIAQPTPIGAAISMQDKGFTNDIFMWLADAEYRAFIFESPAVRLAHRAIGSHSVTFFYDQVFVKEPGAQVQTPWHHDLTFWPIEGRQICSIWMPLDPVTRESSGLEYVRGSHLWNKRFKAVSPDYHPYLLDSDLEDPPDIDAHREAYDLVSWDMDPGDVLIFHPLVVHGSAGNSSTTRRRRALTTRWLGDDVVYAPRRATMPLPPEHGLHPGEHLHGPLFPLVLGTNDQEAT